MAETAHNGVVASHEPGSRFDNIRIVPTNLAWDHNDSICPGLRDEGLVEWRPIVGTDIANRDKPFNHEIVATFTTEQMKPLYMRNYVQLSRIIVDARMQMIGGGSASIGWLTFRDNLAALGVQATETTSLALGFKATIGKTAQTVLTLNSYITSALSTDELDKLFTESTSGMAAGTGGASYGLTPEAYDKSSLIVPPLDYVSITNSVGTAKGGKLGMDSEITFETYAGAPDGRNRALAQGIRIGGKLIIIDMNKTQLKAQLTDWREDVASFTVGDKSGNTYVMTLGAASMSPTGRMSEKPGDSWVEVEIKGDVPMNPNDITDTTFMDWGTTNPKIVTLKGKAGYN
jgi:hypothetical protein